MTSAENQSKIESSLCIAYAKIASIVSLYWLVSISMVFLNNHLLNGSTGLNLDTPLFITWSQCLFVLSITLCGSMLMSGVTNQFIPRMELRIGTLCQLVPLSVAFVAMITFNNLCLKHVGVAFYFVGRSLSIVFNVVLTYYILGRLTSAKAIICCVVIIVGFIFGVIQEEHSSSLSIKAIIYCLCASLCVSLNSILTVRAMSAVNNSIYLLTFYLNLIASVLFIPLIVLSGELTILYSSVFTLTNTVWSLLALSGVFALLIGYVTNLQITHTSPLTHNISGTSKACCQTVMATYLFGQSKTFQWWLSNAIVLIASAGYTRVRQLEMRNAHQRQTTQLTNVSVVETPKCSPN